jgi:hypothetical protein
LPKELKTAKVVVIGKPGKTDMSNPKSYRCISLLSNVAKLTEKAVAQYLTLEGEVHRMVASIPIWISTREKYYGCIDVAESSCGKTSERKYEHSANND